MEFVRGQHKYIITITQPTVTIDAIDYETLGSYRVAIDPADYPGIDTADILYTVIIDGFHGGHKECRLDIVKEAATNTIRLTLEINIYVFKKCMVHVLRPVADCDVSLLANKMDWYNQKIRDQQREIDDLKARLSLLEESAQCLDVYKHYIPTGTRKPTGDLSVCMGTPIRYDNKGPIIIIGDVLTISDRVIVDMKQSPDYPIFELLKCCEPDVFHIEGANAMRGIMADYLQYDIQGMGSLRKIMIHYVNIESVAALISLHNLTELTFRSCVRIRDLCLLKSHKSIKVINITSDMDVGALSGGPFVLNVVQ